MGGNKSWGKYHNPHFRDEETEVSLLLCGQMPPTLYFGDLREVLACLLILVPLPAAQLGWIHPHLVLPNSLLPL